MASELAVKFDLCESVWASIGAEALCEQTREPLLSAFFRSSILEHGNLGDALAFRLSEKLSSSSLAGESLREIFDAAYIDDPRLIQAACHDLEAVRERDPATERICDALLYFKGFHALQGYRIAHWLWEQGRQSIALLLQSQISALLGVDIHPGAQIGSGIMFDHATSIVIGETAIVGNNTSILHEVTLGGTGKAIGQRHPKIREGVLIGAGAKLLGNIEVGAFAKIGAGSVVLSDVPSRTTVVGVPAIAVGTTAGSLPAEEMEHRLTPH